MDEYHATGFTGEELAIAGAPVWGPGSFLEALTAAGSKGASVSRYKGLGEMNPDELWETTMDPRTRTLHRVTIKDAEEASSTFSDLMADNVSARRALIEQMCAGGAVLDI